MSLGQIFRQFVEKNIIAAVPPCCDDDANYHPIVNDVAKRTGWHPAWIDEKVKFGIANKMSGLDSQEVLDDITPKAIIEFLKQIPDDYTIAPRGAKPWDPQPVI